MLHRAVCLWQHDCSLVIFIQTVWRWMPAVY